MKTKFKFLMAATALAVGFSSCSDDNGDELKPGKGEQTTMKISIPMVKTYATDAGKEVESKFSTVDVYVFNGLSLESHKELTVSDFTASAGKWTLNTPIPATTGPKNIYVGLNLPDAAKTAIESGVFSTITPAIAELSTDEKFPMFSVNNATNIQHNVVADGTQNNFQIAVERWAAKVTSRKANTLNMEVPAANAKFTALDFCLGNVNTKMFPLQKLLASGIIEDPNWEGYKSDNTGTYGPADFKNDFGSNASLVPAAYVAVDEDGTALNDRKSKFAMENTSKDHKQGEVTYVSVRGTFVPNAYYTYTGNDLNSTPNTDAVSGEVYVIKSDEGVLFFKDKTQAENCAIQKYGFQAKDVLTYKDGHSYFFIWLDAQNPANIHATLRNHIFDTRITEIKALGAPNPEPEDPDKPTPIGTDLSVEVSIKPWELISTDHSLGD